MVVDPNDSALGALIGLWQFLQGEEDKDTGLDDGIAQDGSFIDGASALAGHLFLDGHDDRFDVQTTPEEDNAFDLTDGRIETSFRQFETNDRLFASVVSRGEFFDSATEGYFGIEVTLEGAVQVTHISNGTSVMESTPDGFAPVGDTIYVSYSWSETNGGQFIVQNQTQDTEYSVDTAAGVNLAIGDKDGTSFTFGARENVDESITQDPNFIKHFDGKIDFVAVYDTSKPPTGPDGIVTSDENGDLIDLAYDGDPDGDFVDNNDSIFPPVGSNDDIIRANGGDDTIEAGEGNDDAEGGTGNDRINGQDGSDTLSGGEGNDIVFGGVDVDADTLEGDADRDILAALAGDTAIGGETGDDFDNLITGGGIPVVTFDPNDATGESGTVTILGDDLTPEGTVDFSEIENVLAIDISDDPVSPPDLVGVNAPAPLPGNPGSIDGVVEGTFGDDLIDVDYTGDPDGDLVDGDDAVPPLMGEEDIVLAGSGDDTVRSGLDNDLVFGGTGDDILEGEEGNDALSGDKGDDQLSGGAGTDILVGGSGDDTLSGDANVTGDGGDSLYGNFGDDEFNNVGPGETIVGGEDPDDGDIDTLDLRGSATPGGTLQVERDPTDSEAGTVRFFDGDGNETGTLSYVEIENVIPCFTPGTKIATPRGERQVEELQVGDKIITRDNGIQEIRWLGTRTLIRSEMIQSRHMQPVLIRQGALGDGLPERNMMVSPNHRVLVSNDKTALYFDESEVLVAAKHLTGLEGVDIVDVPTVTYIHFMFDQHEVVLSDGAWTESFQPGDQSLAGIGHAQRQEIFELFPELNTTSGMRSYQAARRSLKRHEAFVVVS